MSCHREVIGEKGQFKIVLMDSISYANSGDGGVFAVSGSHGGRSSGDITSALPVVGAIFNDAGVGKEDAGIAGLRALDEKGVPAAAVSSTSARIGDARDTWRSGVISHANSSAQKAGITVGTRVEDALTAWLRAR